MLRLAIVRNLQILPKNLIAFAKPNAVNCLTNRLNQSSTALNNPRLFSLTTARYCEAHDEDADADENTEVEGDNNGEKVNRLFQKYAGTSRDRSKVIPYEKSVEYLQSGSYKATYGNKNVWELYRRVHKGQLPRSFTRKTCIRSKVIVTGSPCPICRDEYLVLDHRNLQLLKQFISPYTGEVSAVDM